MNQVLKENLKYILIWFCIWNLLQVIFDEFIKDRRLRILVYITLLIILIFYS